MGRQRKIKSATEFNEKVDEYLQICERNQEPLTLTGLIIHIGLVSRQAFHDQAKRGPAFEDAVKRAKLVVEHGYERNLHSTAATGSIFALKNFGWKDTSTHEITGEGGGPLEIRRTIVDPSTGDDENDA